MAEETKPTSPAAPQQAQSDGGKRGNVTVDQAMMKLVQSEIQARQLAETPTQTEPVVATAPETKPAEPPKVEAVPAGEPVTKPAETASAAPDEENPKVSSEIDVLSQLTSLDPQTQELVKSALKAQREKDQAAVDKRIGKEVARTKQLQEELDRFKVQPAPQPQQSVATPPAFAPQYAAPVPLGEVPDMQSLVNYQAATKEAMRWAEAQLDRDDLPMEGIAYGQKNYTKSDLKAVVRNARVILEDQVPQRAQFFQARQIAQQQAYQQFPWMKDRSSPESLQMQQLVQQFPFVENLPHRDLILGVQIEGLKAIEARRAGKPEPAREPARPKPPSDQAMVAATSGPTRQSEGAGRERVAQEAKQELRTKKGVSVRDTVRFLTQTEKLR